MRQRPLERDTSTTPTIHAHRRSGVNTKSRTAGSSFKFSQQPIQTSTHPHKNTRPSAHTQRRTRHSWAAPNGATKHCKRAAIADNLHSGDPKTLLARNAWSAINARQRHHPPTRHYFSPLTTTAPSAGSTTQARQDTDEDVPGGDDTIFHTLLVAFHRAIVPPLPTTITPVLPPQTPYHVTLLGTPMTATAGVTLLHVTTAGAPAVTTRVMTNAEPPTAHT